MIGIGSIVSHLLLAFATTNESYELDTGTMTEENIILGQQNNDVIAKLRSLGMDKKDLPPHTELRRASILVPLFQRDDDSDNTNMNNNNNIHVLFTQRPKKMKSHGGEVCFPGGKQDPDDGGDDVFTATREAHEEVGLDPRYIESIARMETVESKHGLCVTPIIGLIQPSSVAEPSRLKLSKDEVEAAFAVPLEYFLDNCHHIEEVKWKGYDFLLRTYLYDDPESGCQFKIWGLTAHVVHLVATMAFGKSDK